MEKRDLSAGSGQTINIYYSFSTLAASWQLIIFEIELETRADRWEMSTVKELLVLRTNW